MVIDTLLPLENRAILLRFDVGQTVDDMVKWLTFNDTYADEVEDGAKRTSIDFTLVAATDTEPAKKISIPVWEGETKEIKIDVPVGIRVDSVYWTEPAQANYPIQWVLDYKTGKRFFPITHTDAIVDSQGNKLSSVLVFWEEKVGDALETVRKVRNKLMKEITVYKTASSGTNPETEDGYLCSDIITLFEDDTIEVIKNGNYPTAKYKLVDEDGNVLAGPADSIKYVPTEDKSFHIFASEPVDGTTYSIRKLAVRGGDGGAGNIEITDSNEIVTINDLDKLKTYTLLKADATRVTMEEKTSAAYLKEYDIKQNNIVVGTIKIPKDKCPVGGEIYTADGTEVVGDHLLNADEQYLKLAMADGDPLYISVKDISIDVDDELKDDSENPVQNKVVTKALDDILDLLTAEVTEERTPSSNVFFSVKKGDTITIDPISGVMIGIADSNGELVPITDQPITYVVPEDGSIKIVAAPDQPVPYKHTFMASGFKTINGTPIIGSGDINVEGAATDGVTIEKNASGNLQIKDGGISEDKLTTALKQKIEDAGKADGTTIVKNADSTMSVKDGGISTAKLADDAVTSAKIVDESVTEDKLADGSVSEYKLSQDVKDKLSLAAAPDGSTIALNGSQKLAVKDSGISTAKIADGAVTKDKIAADAIDNSKIADDAVQTENIKDAQVTKAKLANDAKVGSLVVTEGSTNVKLEIKDGAGAVMASDVIDTATTEKAGVVKVTNVLSYLSEDPVQSKEIRKAVDEKTLFFDSDNSDVTDVIKYLIKQGVNASTASTIGQIPIKKATSSVYGEVVLESQIVENSTNGKVESPNAVSAKAVGDYLAEKLGDLVGAMTYMGVIDSTHAVPTTFECGATYVCAEDGTYAGHELLIGQMLIANGDSSKGGTWTAIKPKSKVDNKDAVLSAGVSATIATIDGKDITITPQTIDSALSATSLNAVQNKVVNQAIEDSKVTLTKLTTATAGSFSTYEVKQGTTSLGKVEIPKDFLVTKCELKKSTADDNPETGYKKDDFYIDLTVNTRDGSVTDEHIYCNLYDIQPKVDDTTIEFDDDGKMRVKEEGLEVKHMEADIQTLLNTVGCFIEVKEDGFFLVDNDLNVGFGATTPIVYGVKLANE